MKITNNTIIKSLIHHYFIADDMLEEERQEIEEKYSCIDTIFVYEDSEDTICFCHNYGDLNEIIVTISEEHPVIDIDNEYIIINNCKIKIKSI